MKPECEKCSDIRMVCMACDKGMDDCECGEDQMPVPCDECSDLPFYASGKKLYRDEAEAIADWETVSPRHRTKKRLAAMLQQIVDPK